MENKTLNWRDWLYEEKTKKLNEVWDFGLFKIMCNKCNSLKVEINGEGEVDVGYYEGDAESEGVLMCKCHSCGNAMRIDINNYWILQTKKDERLNRLKRDIMGD